RAGKFPQKSVLHPRHGRSAARASHSGSAPLDPDSNGRARGIRPTPPHSCPALRDSGRRADEPPANEASDWLPAPPPAAFVLRRISLARTALALGRASSRDPPRECPPEPRDRELRPLWPSQIKGIPLPARPCFPQSASSGHGAPPRAGADR